MKRTILKIKHCPTCGSGSIRLVRRSLRENFKGEKYVVPGLSFLECPDCGERVYDPEAMRKIEAYSPAYRKRRPGRRAV